MSYRLSWFLFLTLSVAYSSVAENAPKKQGKALEGELILQVRGLRSDKGHLMLALFDSNASFPKVASRSAVIAISYRSATWRVPSLALGKYAIALYHDENDNGRLDKNLLGIPREDYAFSCGAKAILGPPRWRTASFAVNTGMNVQTINLGMK